VRPDQGEVSFSPGKKDKGSTRRVNEGLQKENATRERGKTVVPWVGQNTTFTPSKRECRALKSREKRKALQKLVSHIRRGRLTVTPLRGGKMDGIPLSEDCLTPSWGPENSNRKDLNSAFEEK